METRSGCPIHIKTLIVLALSLTLHCEVGADNHPAPCYDDTIQCVQNLRKLMMDEDTFWFGSGYARRCAATPFASNCMNPDKNGKSIMTRLWNATDQVSLAQAARVNTNLQLAQVTFRSPAGKYEACGHAFYTGAVEYRVDPMAVSNVDSWSLSENPPYVIWDQPVGADDSSLYTVIVWDVGYFFLHGLYINARGGDLSTATTIDPYHGPLNPLLRANAYLFAVFRQSQFLDPGRAAASMREIMAANRRALSVSQFQAAMGGSISDLVAANVMSVVGDAYSMERQKMNNIIDSCPSLISQNPALKTILDGVGIDASWSPETTILNYAIDPYLTTLTVSLGVQYTMARDMWVDSCCVNTIIPRTSFEVDPLGTEVTLSAVTSSAPRLQMSPVSLMGEQFDSIRNKVYTLMLVDVTEAISQKENPLLIIHWLVNDIQSADVSTGVETLPYMGLNPFEPNQARTYLFMLFQQATPYLDTTNLKDFVSDSCPDFIYMRCGAQLPAMMKAWGLQDIVGVTLLQVEQDHYARKRVYSDFKAKLMVDVCDGQPGYEDPCPNMQYQRGAKAVHSLSAGLLIGLMVCWATYLIQL